MKRTTYKGFIINTDDLGRPYIYNPASPYSEESDRQYLISSDYLTYNGKPYTDLQAAKYRVDREPHRIEKVLLKTGELVEMDYSDLCKALGGYYPEVGFIDVDKRGRITYTCGKDHELRALHSAVISSDFVLGFDILKALR